MALIKSALELALERTRDIQGDKASLDAKHFKELGMKLAAKVEAEPDLDIKKQLANYKGQELSWVKEGVCSILLSTLNLPANQAAVDRLQKFIPLFAQVSSKPRDMEGMLGELSQFYTQYLQQREQMIQAMEKQLEPRLRQKEETLYQQTGRRTRLSIETDPESSKFVTANLDKLNAQYEGAMEGIRTEIKGLLA